MHIWPNWPLLFKRWITLSTRQISIQWIGQLIPNTYLLNSDSSVGWRLIQLLYNRRLYFIFIYCLRNLSAWHRWSVPLLQAVIFTIIVFPSYLKLCWKGRKSTNKECCIAVIAGLLKKQIFTLDFNDSPVQVFPSPVNPALHAHA